MTSTERANPRDRLPLGDAHVGDAFIMTAISCRSPTRGCRLMALGSAIVLSTACVVGIDTRGYLQHDRRQFDVGESAHVSLSTFDGSIEVHGWDRAVVEVNIEKRAASKELVESIEIASTQEGGQIRVEAKPPKSGTWETNVLRGSGMSAKLVAYVPVNSRVSVETADGPVAVERLNGVIELRTLDGPVNGVDLSGTLRVYTADGSVRLESVTGAADVKTLDGSITVSGRPEALKLLSSDGSIVVRIGEGVPMTTDWEIDTFDGRVELHLPSTFDALVDARTEDGRVTSDAMVADSGGERSRRELLGRVGAGGRTIKIRTGDGRISIRGS